MKIIVCVLCGFLSGCGITQHAGRIEIFNAAGESTGYYVAMLDRPMMIEATDSNGVTVKADSRGDSSWGQFIKGLVEIITLGLVIDR
jgi:hypothetical protein